jgi:hypothetical protein
VKRNPSIERALRWHFWKPYQRTPRFIISPRSVIRLVRADPDWDTDLKIGDEFRIGYYSRQDGPNCVWLVDANGNYNQTWDQNSLLETFEIVSLSDETDIYGLHRPVLEPL